MKYLKPWPIAAILFAILCGFIGFIIGEQHPAKDSRFRYEKLRGFTYRLNTETGVCEYPTLQGWKVFQPSE